MLLENYMRVMCYGIICNTVSQTKELKRPEVLRAEFMMGFLVFQGTMRPFLVARLYKYATASAASRKRICDWFKTSVLLNYGSAAML